MRMYRQLLLAALALPILPATAADATPYPIDAFVEQQQFSKPRLSPDGKHLAVNVRIQRGGRTVPTMTIYTLGPSIEILATIGLPGYEIPIDFFWINNERLVVHKGVEVGLREAPVNYGELLAVNLDGSKQEYLYGYKGFQQSSRGARYGADYGWGYVAEIPRPRDGHILVGSYDWDARRSMLYEINSINSTRKLVADIPERKLNFIVQNNGKPRFAVGRDEKSDAALYRLDDASGQWRRVSVKPGTELTPFAFSPDDSAFYANYSEAGKPHVIVRESLANGQRTVIASDALGSITEMEYTAEPATPFAFGTWIGIPKVKYLDEKLPEAVLHKTLSGLFPDGYVHFINFSDDGQKLLFSVRSDRDPGSFYLFDKVTGKADLLLTNMPQIEPADMPERHPVVYTARDGLQITGFLTLPKGAAGKKAPLVVMPHGGPFGIYDNWYFDVDAAFLASRGYAVLQPNYRGSGARGVGFEHAGYREWGGKLIDDIVDGAKWAVTQPGVDGTRVCAYGWSYGGYAALMLAAREPSMFKCAVGAAGPYHLAQKYKDDTVKGETSTINFYKKTMGEDKALLDAQSPTTMADRIKAPVLLIHGSKDERVPIVHAQMMRDALIKAGHPPEWMEVKNEGHGFYDSEHRKEFYLNLEAFLSRHIGK